MKQNIQIVHDILFTKFIQFNCNSILWRLKKIKP